MRSPCYAPSFRFVSTLFVLQCLIFSSPLRVLGLATAAATTTTSSVITGASGYVGRAVAHALLEYNQKQGLDNSSVVCLVRASRLPQERQYWQKEPCVTVLPYDMLDGGSTLRSALEHCAAAAAKVSKGTCVYHVASWFGPTKDHVQAATNNVKGTRDLVQILSEFEGTKLVLTSSMAAVRGTGQEPQNGKYYTEADWNTVSRLSDNNWGSSYQWSKQESERVAWELCKELKIPMVSLCPSFVFGPPSCDESMTSITSSITSFSTELVASWIRGTSKVQSRLFADVRDVAQAHVAAGRLPEAVGQRFLVTTERRLASEVVARILRDKCAELRYDPDQPITFDAEFSGGAIPIGQKEVEAEERLLQCLGISLRPAEQTMDDMSTFLVRMLQLGDALRQSDSNKIK